MTQLSIPWRSSWLWCWNWLLATVMTSSSRPSSGCVYTPRKAVPFGPASSVSHGAPATGAAAYPKASFGPGASSATDTGPRRYGNAARPAGVSCATVPSCHAPGTTVSPRAADGAVKSLRRRMPNVRSNFASAAHSASDSADR